MITIIFCLLSNQNPTDFIREDIIDFRFHTGIRIFE